MERNILLTIILPFLLMACIGKTPNSYNPSAILPEIPSLPASIGAVPLPEGYKRINYPEGSFVSWLRKISIMDDGLSPGYELKTDNSFIYTPEWTFEPTQLRRW